MRLVVALLILHNVRIRDILLTNVDGWRLRLSRAALLSLLDLHARPAPKGGKYASNHVLPLDSSPGSLGKRPVR